MAILLLSPLSASMLSLVEVQITTVEDFQRLELPRPLISQDTTTDLTYFRTISSVVHDLKSSAWLTDDYAVLPLFPTSMDTPPFEAILTMEIELWQGTTSVYQADLQCIPMQVTSRNYTSPDELTEHQILTFESSDGCTVERNVSGFSGLVAPPTGGWWSNTATSNFPSIENTLPQEINQTQTSECDNRGMFFVVSPFYTNQSDQPVDSYAQLCSPTYLVADDVATTITNTRDTSTMTIDKEAFERTKVRLDRSVIDVQAFEAQFLDQAWSAYFNHLVGLTREDQYMVVLSYF